MPGLSPELGELVIAYRRANLPTEADCERILEGLRVRLGTPLPTVTMRVPPGRVTPQTDWRKRLLSFRALKRPFAAVDLWSLRRR